MDERFRGIEKFDKKIWLASPTMHAGSEYKRKAKERVQRYRSEVDITFPVDTKHMDTKAKLMYPFLKAGWVMPIHAASCMKRVRRNR